MDTINFSDITLSGGTKNVTLKVSYGDLTAEKVIKYNMLDAPQDRHINISNKDYADLVSNENTTPNTIYFDQTADMSEDPIK